MHSPRCPGASQQCKGLTVPWLQLAELAAAEAAEAALIKYAEEDVSREMDAEEQAAKSAKRQADYRAVARAVAEAAEQVAPT